MTHSSRFGKDNEEKSQMEMRTHDSSLDRKEEKSLGKKKLPVEKKNYPITVENKKINFEKKDYECKVIKISE